MSPHLSPSRRNENTSSEGTSWRDLQAISDWKSLSSHPSHHYVTQPSEPRAAQRIPILQSRYLPEIQQYLTNNQTPPDEYKDIHTSTLETYLGSAPPNKVLNMAQPEIHSEEDKLPRHFWTTLSQLRSGYCSRLQDYRHRVTLSPVLWPLSVIARCWLSS